MSLLYLPLATVQYELSLLRRAFNLAVRTGLLLYRPSFPSLRIENARKGFFEHGDYKALVRELPDYLRPIVTFAYYTGWRIPSEVLTLSWTQVDLEAGEVRLEPGTTKSGEGRTFPVGSHPQLASLLREQRERTRETEKPEPKEASRTHLLPMRRRDPVNRGAPQRLRSPGKC